MHTGNVQHPTRVGAMPRRTSTNSSDKDNLLEEGIPTLPILTHARHRRFIKEQRTIIRTLIRDFSPERQVFYTFFDTPRIVHKDALEDILCVQHAFNEIIFDQRSQTVWVFYIRNLYTSSRGARRYTGRPASIRLGRQESD